ncbi:MAG: hypothetical protein MZV70_60625 [Desulfobacterales bacterium]|nr:hypothetical protein [Desulfobacterales bacterium]
MTNTLKSLGVCLGASTVSLVQVEQDPDGGGTSAPRIVPIRCTSTRATPSAPCVRALAGVDLRVLRPDRRHRPQVPQVRQPDLRSRSRRRSNPPTPSSSPPGSTARPWCPPAARPSWSTCWTAPGASPTSITGNKCASGTGEFFLQQLRRMNVSLEEAAQFAAVETPHHVSGRCSVFCKSDCTHATNKGIPKAQVTAGLCQMMANKILELLKKVERRDIMVTGGTAQNHMMIDYLRARDPGAGRPRARRPTSRPWAPRSGRCPTRPRRFRASTACSSRARSPSTAWRRSQDFAGQVEFKTIDARRDPAGGRLHPGPRRGLHHHQGRAAAALRPRPAGLRTTCAPTATRWAPRARATARSSSRCGGRWTRAGSTSSAWG